LTDLQIFRWQCCSANLYFRILGAVAFFEVFTAVCLVVPFVCLVTASFGPEAPSVDHSHHPLALDVAPGRVLVFHIAKHGRALIILIIMEIVWASPPVRRLGRTVIVWFVDLELVEVGNQSIDFADVGISVGILKGIISSALESLRLRSHFSSFGPVVKIPTVVLATKDTINPVFAVGVFFSRNNRAYRARRIREYL
jgi:hypothetical protein